MPGLHLARGVHHEDRRVDDARLLEELVKGSLVFLGPHPDVPVREEGGVQPLPWSAPSRHGALDADRPMRLCQWLLQQCLRREASDALVKAQVLYVRKSACLAVTNPADCRRHRRVCQTLVLAKVVPVGEGDARRASGADDG